MHKRNGSFSLQTETSLGDPGARCIYVMKSSRGEKWPAGRWPGHPPGSKGRTHGGPQGRRAGFRGQMQICPLGLLSGLTKSSRGEQWPAGREPSHLSGSKGRTRGGPQGRRTGFRGEMRNYLSGLLSGLTGSTGCAPGNPRARRDRSGASGTRGTAGGKTHANPQVSNP